MRETIFLLFIVYFISPKISYGQDFEYQLTKLNANELSANHPFSNPITLSFKLKNESNVKIEFYNIVTNDSINEDMIKNTNLIKKYEFLKLDSGDYRFSWNLTFELLKNDEDLKKFIYVIFIDNKLFERQIFSIAK